VGRERKKSKREQRLPCPIGDFSLRSHGSFFWASFCSSAGIERSSFQSLHPPRLLERESLLGGSFSKRERKREARLVFSPTPMKKIVLRSTRAAPSTPRQARQAPRVPLRAYLRSFRACQSAWRKKNSPHESSKRQGFSLFSSLCRLRAPPPCFSSPFSFSSLLSLVPPLAPSSSSATRQPWPGRPSLGATR